MAIDLGHRLAQPPAPPMDLEAITVHTFDRLAETISQLSGVSSEMTWGEVERAVLTQTDITRAVQNALLEQPHRTPNSNALVRQIGKQGPGLAQPRVQTDRPMFSELDAQKPPAAPRPSKPNQPLLGQGAITDRMVDFELMANNPWAWLDKGIKDTARRVENMSFPRLPRRQEGPENADPLFGNNFQDGSQGNDGLFGNPQKTSRTVGESSTAEVQEPPPQAMVIPPLVWPDQQAYAVNVPPSVLNCGFPEDLFTVGNPGIVEIVGLGSLSTPEMARSEARPSILPSPLYPSEREVSLPPPPTTVLGGLSTPEVAEARPSILPSPLYPSEGEVSPSPPLAALGGLSTPEMARSEEVRPSMLPSSPYPSEGSVSLRPSPAPLGGFSIPEVAQAEAVRPSMLPSPPYPSEREVFLPPPPAPLGTFSIPEVAPTGLSGGPTSVMGSLLPPAENETVTGGLGLLTGRPAEAPGLAPALERPAPFGGESSNGINPVMGPLMGGVFGNSTAVSADRDLTTEFKEQSLKTDTAMFGMLDDPRNSDFGRFLQGDVLNREGEGRGSPQVARGLLTVLGILTGIGMLMNALGISPEDVVEGAVNVFNRVRGVIEDVKGFFENLAGVLGPIASQIGAWGASVWPHVRDTLSKPRTWALAAGGAVLGGVLGLMAGGPGVGVAGALAGAGLGIGLSTFLTWMDSPRVPVIGDAPQLADRIHFNLQGALPVAIAGAALGGLPGLLVAGPKGGLVGAIAGAGIGLMLHWRSRNAQFDNLWEQSLTLQDDLRQSMIGGGMSAADADSRLAQMRDDGSLARFLFGSGTVMVADPTTPGGVSFRDPGDSLNHFNFTGATAGTFGTDGHRVALPDSVMGGIAEQGFLHRLAERGVVEGDTIAARRSSFYSLSSDARRGHIQQFERFGNILGFAAVEHQGAVRVMAVTGDLNQDGRGFLLSRPGFDRAFTKSDMTLNNLPVFLPEGLSWEFNLRNNRSSGFQSLMGSLGAEHSGSNFSIDTHDLAPRLINAPLTARRVSADDGILAGVSDAVLGLFGLGNMANPAVAVPTSAINVRDAIVTKTGQVIHTHPEDSIYAFKGNVEINPVRENQEPVQAASPFEAGEGNTVVFGNPAYGQPAKPGTTNNVTQNNYSTNLPFSDFMVVGV